MAGPIGSGPGKRTSEERRVLADRGIGRRAQATHTFTPRNGSSARAPKHRARARGGDVRPEAAPLPQRLLGVVVLKRKYLRGTFLRAFPRVLRTIKKQIRFWVGVLNHT